MALEKSAIYRRAVTRAKAQRHDANGTRVEPVSEEHRLVAQAFVDRMAKQKALCAAKKAPRP